MNNPAINNKPAAPWYLYGWTWALIFGPLLVVIASAVTIYIAYNNSPVIENPDIGRFAQVKQQASEDHPPSPRTE